MKTDILFIHPVQQRKIYQDLADEFTAIDVPLWEALLADYGRRQGCSCAIHDVSVEGWDETIMARMLDQYQPALIVLMVFGQHPSASTQTMPAASQIAADLKQADASLPIAMGGTHPSALPERTLNEEHVDYVITGEGYSTVVALVRYLKGKQALHAIPGLWYREQGKCVFTGYCAQIADLDREMPRYAWDLIPPLSRYRAHNWHCFHYFRQSHDALFRDVRSPYVSLYTSLGCPFNCNFCCISALFGKPGIRYWSVESVVAWIDELVARHQIRNIRFADELFVLSVERVERLCDLLIQRDYGLNIWVYGRVDTIREALLAKMKRAGINWIALGIESGNERVRKGVNKSLKTNIHDVVKQIQAHGIAVIGNYMFGLPDDDQATMRETFDLAMDLRCEYANFYTVMAYPGSALYRHHVKLENAAAILPQRWDAYSQHGYETQPLPTKYLSAKEVLKFRDEAFGAYYKHPPYLSYMESLFGEPVRRHIERMLAIKISRRLTAPDGRAGK